MDIKGEINSNTVTVGDFNNLLISMDRSSREKINKETLALKDILEQMDLCFQNILPKAEDYKFL